MAHKHPKAEKKPSGKGLHQQRMCVICRNSADKRQLLRFVMKDAVLCWDKEHCISGRGAYVHPKVSCWSKMRETGKWEHNLRLGQGTVRDLGQTLAALMEQVRGEIEGLGSVELERSAKPIGKKRVRI